MINSRWLIIVSFLFLSSTGFCQSYFNGNSPGGPSGGLVPKNNPTVSGTLTVASTTGTNTVTIVNNAIYFNGLLVLSSSSSGVTFTKLSGGSSSLVISSNGISTSSGNLLDNGSGAMLLSMVTVTGTQNLSPSTFLLNGTTATAKWSGTNLFFSHP